MGVRDKKINFAKMENERTIIEYLDSLNNSNSNKKVEEKKSTPKINYPKPVIDTSKYVNISEINKLFDALTTDVQKLHNAINNVSQRNKIYVNGEINALEYCRDLVSKIITIHLK